MCFKKISLEFPRKIHLMYNTWCEGKEYCEEAALKDKERATIVTQLEELQWEGRGGFMKQHTYVLQCISYKFISYKCFFSISDSQNTLYYYGFSKVSQFLLFFSPNSFMPCFRATVTY